MPHRLVLHIASVVGGDVLGLLQSGLIVPVGGKVSFSNSSEDAVHVQLLAKITCQVYAVCSGGVWGC